MQARRVEDVRPGRLERLQPPDGVVEVGAVPQEVLAPGRQHEISGQGVARLCCGRDPLDRQAEVEDRIVALAGIVLDRAAGEADLGRGPDRLGDTVRAVAEPLLEVGRDRKGGRRDNGAAMASVSSLDTRPSGTPRENAIRHSWSRGHESPCRRESGGADVPRIGNDEAAGLLMKRTERRTLTTHPIGSLGSVNSSVRQ